MKLPNDSRVNTLHWLTIAIQLALLVFLYGNYYRQTQIQKAMMQMCRNMADMKLDSDIRVQEYYDIMRALDIQKKTGEIVISREELE